MKRHVVMFGLGVLFAVGLGISGMTLPAKVIGFLDVTGAWDPALMFVMGGAVVVFGIGYPLITKGNKPLFSAEYMLPTRNDLTPRLIIGSALFGIGWGASGFCPGPALTSLATGALPVMIFVGGMVGGMFLFQSFDAWVVADDTPKTKESTPPKGASATTP